MKQEIVFVTHNTGKIKSAEKYFKNLKFTIFNYELDEPRIDELNGFPRAFVNFALETIGIQGILKLMESKENRKCSFNECLAYHDGKEIHYFYGKHPRKFVKYNTRN